MFCPFNPKATAENEHPPDADAEHASDEYIQEVNTIEKMIELASKTGGKCPFSFGKTIAADQDSSEAGDVELRPKERTVGDCPFNFGFKIDADSEDEADVPKSHRASTSCPLVQKHKPTDKVCQPIKIPKSSPLLEKHGL